MSVTLLECVKYLYWFQKKNICYSIGALFPAHGAMSFHLWDSQWVWKLGWGVVAALIAASLLPNFWTCGEPYVLDNILRTRLRGMQLDPGAWGRASGDGRLGTIVLLYSSCLPLGLSAFAWHLAQCSWDTAISSNHLFIFVLIYLFIKWNSQLQSSCSFQVFFLMSSSAQAFFIYLFICHQRWEPNCSFCLKKSMKY